MITVNKLKFAFSEPDSAT